jgi:hypothetical protein
MRLISDQVPFTSIVGCLQYLDWSHLAAVDWDQSTTPPLAAFIPPTPHHTPTPVNRGLRCANLCTVFWSNDAVRASPPGVSKQPGIGQTAIRQIPPLWFLCKKGGVYIFLKLLFYTPHGYLITAIKKPPEGG